jgi:predicted nuclease with TOPRIM domain
MKWFEEIQQRYFALRPEVKNKEEFDRLSALEQSYLKDLKRLIDEVSQLTKRMDDFRYVLELITKVMSGPLKPEDREA